MDVRERVLQRLEELLAEADELRRNAQAWGYEGFWVDHPGYVKWSLSCLNVVEQVAGKDSQYYQTMIKNAKGGHHEYFVPFRAALQAVRDDYANGWLGDLKAFVAAEVFSDFLDMAEYLHSEGYHIPAASIAGAVLEDCLRRLHLKHVGPWQGDSSIAKLNTGLYTEGFYSNTQQQQVLAWGAIRNDADHGHFDRVDPNQVRLMIQGIRDFVAKYEG